MVNPIIVQTGYYFIVMLLSILVCSLVQKGFFWAFWKVRVSFGRLVLVKVRTVNRDYFAVGQIEDGFLILKHKDGTKRMAITDADVLYRALGMIWADYDEEKNALMKRDYTAVSGYDAVKHNNLYLRALYRPPTSDTKEKLLIGLLILAIVISIAIAFGLYKQNYTIQFMAQQIAGLKDLLATPTVAGNVIT